MIIINTDEPIEVQVTKCGHLLSVVYLPANTSMRFKSGCSFHISPDPLYHVKKYVKK